MKYFLYALAVLTVVLLGQTYGVESGFIFSQAYNIAMHLLGGLGMGLFLFALNRAGVIHFNNPRRAIIVCVLLIGIGWEIFEAVYDITGYELWTNPYYLDTLKDITDDIIGAVMAVWSMSGIGRYKAA